MAPTRHLAAALGLLVLLAGHPAAATRMPADVRAKLAGRAVVHPAAVESPAVVASSAAPAKTPLSVFQVAQPVLGPDGPVYQSLDGNGGSRTVVAPGIKAADSCEQVLMVHSFGQSYGAPFVGMLF